MKIALCTELRNVEWFESRLRSLFAGDGQLVIDELWNEKQLSQALRRKGRVPLSRPAAGGESCKQDSFSFFFSGKEARHENRTLYGIKECRMV